MISHLSSFYCHHSTALSSVIWHKWTVICHQSTVTCHILSIISHLWSVTCHLSSVISHLSSVTHHWSSTPVVRRLSSFISHLSSVTSHPSSVISNLLSASARAWLFCLACFQYHNIIILMNIFELFSIALENIWKNIMTLHSKRRLHDLVYPVKSLAQSEKENGYNRL